MENILNLFKKPSSNKQQVKIVPPLINACASVIFSYKWTIANYSRLYDDGCPWKWTICSDTVSPPNNQLFKLELYLYPKGSSESVRDYVSIGVGVKSLPQIYEKKIRCRWNVSIEDDNGELCGTRDSEIYSLYSGESRIITDLIHCQELLFSPWKYLPNSNLTLQFAIHLQADEPIFNVITNNELGTSRFDCANKVSKVVHTWTVENFGDLFGENAVAPNFIHSDHFPSSIDKQNEQFCLRLYLNGYDEKSKDKLYIGIFNDNENSATVHRRMSILDMDGQECNPHEWTEKIEAKNGRYLGLSRDYLTQNSNEFVRNNKLRIYCEMSYMVDSCESNGNLKQTQMLESVHKSESITDVTQKAIHFVSYQWTIPKSTALGFNSKTNQSIDSHIIKPPTDLRYMFHLRLFPKGHNNQNNSDEYVSLELFNDSSSINQATVQYRISILDKNEHKWTRWYNQSTISKGDKIRNSNFIPLSFLEAPFVINNYLTDDKLTILCELWVVHDKKIYKTKPNPSSSATVNMPNANLQGAIVNVNGALNMKDFNSNSSNVKNKSY